MATRKTPKVLADELIKEAESIRKIREDHLKLLEQYNQNLEKQLEILKTVNSLEKKEEELRKNSIKEEKEKTQQLEKQEKIHTRQKELDKDVVDSLKIQLQLHTGINNSASTIAGKFLKSKLEIIDMQKGLEKSSFSTNLLVSAVDRLIENSFRFAVSQEEEFAQLNRNIGAYGKYESSITDVVKQSTRYGISIQDATEATKSLFTSLNTFSALSESTQKDLIETTSRLEKFGISSQTSAENIMTLSKSMGVSEKTASQLQNQLAVLADDIGIPPKQMAESFALASPKLAFYGKDMQRVFVELAKQSKETGISISGLTTIASKFNTFEGAADAAGKLNAILGGDLLNSTELMLATDAERNKMIKESIQLSGKNWSEMNRFEKAAIASAAGITDMNEANNFFAPTTKKVTAELRSAEQAAAMLEKRAGDVQTVMQQWQNITNALTISIRPLVDKLHSIVMFIAQGIDKINKYNSNMLGYISIVGIAAGAALALMATIVKSVKTVTSFTDMFKQAKKATDGLSNSSNISAMSIKNMATQASASAKKMLSFGAAIMMIGAGVGAAAYGLGNLVSAFSGLNTEQIDAAKSVLMGFGVAVGAIVIALAALAASSPVSGPAVALLVAIGGAVALIGAGVGAASYGLSLLIKTIADMPLSAAKGLVSLKDSLESMSEIDVGKINAIVKPFETLNQSIAGAATSMKNFNAEYAKMPAISPKTSAVNQSLMVEKPMTTQTTNQVAQPSANSPIQINLQLDGKTIGSILTPYIEKNINLNLTPNSPPSRLSR